MLSMKSLKERYYHPPIVPPFDFVESLLIPFTRFAAGGWPGAQEQ
jgi:hypothetical protein